MGLQNLEMSEHSRCGATDMRITIERIASKASAEAVRLKVRET
jgi:hypothetical protein